MDSAKHTSPGPIYKMTDLYLALAITFILVLLTYFLSRKLRKAVNVVLLTGLSNSGKTAIFTKVIYNKPKSSVTSLRENDAFVEEFNLRLIDLPGADRLRGRCWEQFRTKARHVVFLIDSTTIEDKIRELSEYLYTLMSDGIIYKNKIQFTIACNKQDIEGARSKDFIKPLLERELSAIRATKTGQLGKTSNDEDEDYLAKLDSEKISLEQLNVKLIEISVKDPTQLIKLIH